MDKNALYIDIIKKYDNKYNNNKIIYNNKYDGISNYGNMWDSIIAKADYSQLVALRAQITRLSKLGYTSQDINRLIRANISSQSKTNSVSTPVKNQSTVSGNSTTPSPVFDPVTPSINTSVIDRFMRDILSKSKDRTFRGWILPNGQLLSQYNDNISRQDHGKLARLFMRGLEEINPAAYTRMMQLYDEYCRNNRNVRDAQESFAVEVLGWMQISEFGSRRIISRGERWQDRLIDVFIRDYNFDLVISDNGTSHYTEFMPLYDSIQEIISKGLEKQYAMRRSLAV